MTEKEKFMLLSNSTMTGMTTCKIMAGERLLTDKLNKSDLNGYKDIMKEHGLRLIEPGLDIFRSPKYLWARGDGTLSNNAVSIIGARKCTPYGRKIAYELAYHLAKKDIQIISGLAYGVDIEAHRGALDAGGSTVAVLGSGILNCYPKAHQPEYDRILEKGLILSEYGFYQKPLKHQFPFRNRLISALCDVLIVVEAKKKSGTMITVNYGLDQGKTIMAVPGPIDSKLSEGTNMLIGQGARLLSSIEDVFDELGIV
ncbi:DNA-protecting protein DprA [Acidaminobacter sp. JC074]|uniref:DNA-processing protein DprA n=1 Tax=Acidaminobacter sp. JC074 TaxID=2530199 RepID=UPI001F0EEE3A|nr:DNA-processing protein DprA [Acidaminobacter sp. JC074]MCH4888711.1 DNA-protecting protein DprA [Acidaminobacter sp. JC074]